MQLIKVGAASLNQTPLDWARNREHIVEAIQAARKADVDVLCLPELCITGYGCEDAFFSTDLQRRALEMLLSLLDETKGMFVHFGLPILYRNALFNTVAVVVDGKLLGFVAKQHLAGDGVHYEPRWFKPWKADFAGEIEISGSRYPIGDLLFNCGGLRVGFEICEDAWVAERTGGPLARRGVDLMLNPSASHFAFEKRHVRERFVLEGSRAFGVTYIHSNLVGNESGRVIFEGGSLIASAGELVARGPRLHFAQMSLISAVVDVDKTRMIQSRTASFQPDMNTSGEHWITTSFVAKKITTVTVSSTRECESPNSEKMETFSRAVALGLFDYLRKAYSRGFVVSLSGGADSAAVAVLVSLSLRMAIKELGLKQAQKLLGYYDAFASAENADDLVKKALTCVYQATRNSGEVTLRAATAIAKGLNATWHVIDIDPIVVAYIETIEKELGRKLTWKEDDITLQNIQARVRSPSIWMFANIKNALLLATSNRSEAAVGYATMDGDTSGGLSPIAGIDKAFLRLWLRWMETTGPKGLGNLPELSMVNDQQPTAELRPPERDQTDESDLMPYPVLDAIERAAIRDKKAPLEVYHTLRAIMPKLDSELLLNYIERFFRLWARNQWKRERYAPSFHLDDENLDPKTWCRFPILSGAFTEELKALRAFRARVF